MNAAAQSLGMSNTFFDSPHGLCNIYNTSTAHDIAILTNRCMKISLFTFIVKTRSFEFKSEKRLYQWQNTNKLLGHDCDDGEAPVKHFKGTMGCKTGVTPSAGPCFSGYFSRATILHDGTKIIDNVIVVVLNCKNMETRWKEVPRLVQWF